MLRAILFDLDETLLDRTHSLCEFARQQYTRFHPHFAHIPIAHYVQRFVGDNPQADIAGAKGAGMMTIWFTPRARGECTIADGVCGGLGEIVVMVDTLAHEYNA